MIGALAYPEEGDDGGTGERRGRGRYSLDVWLGSLYIYATLSYLHLFTQFSRINVGTVEHHMLYLSLGNEIAQD